MPPAKYFFSALLVASFLKVQAQVETKSYAPESMGNFAISFNPLDFYFGHATGHLEFFNKKRPSSFRTTISVGVNDDKEDYNWAAGFHYKRFYPGHYHRSAGWFAPGIMVGRTTYFFEQKPFLVMPQLLGGWHYAPSKEFVLTLETGVGTIWALDSNYKPDHPVTLFLGLIVGFRS